MSKETKPTNSPELTAALSILMRQEDKVPQYPAVCLGCASGDPKEQGCLSTSKPVPCKHDECSTCGIAVHPHCFEPKPAPLPEEVEEAVHVFKLLLEDVPADTGLVFRCEEGTVRTILDALSALQAQLAAKERECEELKSIRSRMAEMRDGLREDWKQQRGRAESAEAFKQRVMVWARGKCIYCGMFHRAVECRTCAHGVEMGPVDKWTPPQAWEV